MSSSNDGKRALARRWLSPPHTNLPLAISQDMVSLRTALAWVLFRDPSFTLRMKERALRDLKGCITSLRIPDELTLNAYLQREEAAWLEFRARVGAPGLSVWGIPSRLLDSEKTASPVSPEEQTSPNTMDEPGLGADDELALEVECEAYDGDVEEEPEPNRRHFVPPTEARALVAQSTSAQLVLSPEMDLSVSPRSWSDLEVSEAALRGNYPPQTGNPLLDLFTEKQTAQRPVAAAYFELWGLTESPFLMKEQQVTALLAHLKTKAGRTLSGKSVERALARILDYLHGQ